MYHIIINPASRSGKGQKLWEQAEPLFQAAGVDYEVHFSTEERGLRDIVEQVTREESARQDEEASRKSREELLAGNTFWAVLEDPAAAEDKTDLIIMGGDGSLNEALNGVEDFSRTRIGFVPVGSANDFARDAKISKNVAETVGIILKGDQRKKLDLGQVTWWEDPEEGSEKPLPRTLHTRNFLISSGVGFDAQVCYEADHSLWKKALNKIRLGKLIYIITAIRLILTARRARIEAEVYGENGQAERYTFEDCLFAVCMNHRFEGGGFQFAPGAKPTDGLLDLCIPSGISRGRFFLLFPRAYSGGHVGAKGIHIIQGSRVVLRSDIPLYLHTDGEVPARTREAELTIQPGVLEFLD